MGISLQVQESLDNFFAGISDWREGYVQARLSYVGIRKEGKIAIVSAQINLALVVNEPPRALFDAANVVAGEWDIPQETVSIEQVIDDILSEEGLLVSGHERMGLRAGADRPISSSLPSLLHHAGLKTQRRLVVLTLTGSGRHELIRQPDLDWQLKAAPMPFESIQELITVYRAGSPQGDYSILEVVANSAVLTSENIEVRGDTARIGVCVGARLNRSLARVGFRAVSRTGVTRGAFDGEQLSWHEQSGIAIGLADVKVEPGSVVECIASYKGEAHHVTTHMDKDHIQNPRMIVLRAVEHSTEVIQNYLLPDLPGRARSADDFETAVGWVLWALGFAPVSFGLNPKTRDAFDVVANDDRGNFLVVECTLGLLKAESKLSRLMARAARVRDDLMRNNLGHLRVLPVIVSAMNRDHLTADLEAARQLGAVVVAREDLERALVLMERFPKADHWFDRAAGTLIPGSFLGGAQIDY